MPTTPLEGWLTTPEVATALALHPGTVRRLIARGTLAATTIAGRLDVVTVEEVERYRREHLNGQGWVARKSANYVPSKKAEYYRQYRLRRKQQQEHEQ